MREVFGASAEPAGAAGTLRPERLRGNGLAATYPARCGGGGGGGAPWHGYQWGLQVTAVAASGDVLVSVPRDQVR